MKGFRGVVSLLLVMAFSVTALFGQSSFDVSGMDSKTSACADFYQYANGGWLAANPIPAAYPAWGVANVLVEKNRDVLHEILEAAARNSAAKKGSNEQKVGDYYASCMDEAKIEAEGLKPIQPELDLISTVKDQKSLQVEIAHLHSFGYNAVFGSGSNRDFKNAADVTIGIVQSGLGLPTRDYYFKDDARSKAIRDEYVKHVAKMFELMGDDAAKAASEADAVMKVETKLAEASLPPVEMREPEKLYHRMHQSDLKTLAPTFDWIAYFRAVGHTTADVNVATPEFFKAMDRQLTETSIADWQTYLRWNIINRAASGLAAKFVDEDFHFKGTVLQGARENLPRWKRCVSATDGALGEALGAVYVQKAFPPAAKERALQMVRNLEAALKSDITTLSWMSPETRKKATLKLDAFMNKIGYPDKWRDYAALTVDRTSYQANRFRVSKFNEDRDWARVGKPVDRMEWGMTPPTVNAYYNPQNNEIVFPAGILQPPYFNPNADDALNYGGMGSVIGHEMTHGFDDQGAKFDPTGNLANWWSDADLKAFQAKSQCIVDQFNGFQVEKGLNMNGQLVQGESIADLGGLVIAYAAFQQSMKGKPRPANIDGFTPEQRFFLGYARGWASNIRPELARLIALQDPHPLNKFRVNGPLSNLPEFAAAFQCKQGDPMVRPEKDRCAIW
ncbi:MAG TPA: M13 family metallopeptidase [Pyrinomonadaceae bacterium]|nr:M13 family metallopeptidase [Pyrinomonadaceae bacterium]